MWMAQLEGLGATSRAMTGDNANVLVYATDVDPSRDRIVLVTEGSGLNAQSRKDLVWSGYEVPADTAEWVYAFVGVAETYPACIVISDMSTGFWTFKMDGFNGWNGEDWGMPNISSVQNWDEESKEGTK